MIVLRAALLVGLIFSSHAQAVDEDLTGPTPSIADVQSRFDTLYLPKLQTDRERLQYLLWLDDRIPQFFQQADRYPVSLYDLLSEQDTIQQKLLEHPSFRQLLSVRPALQEIEVGPSDGKPIFVELRRVSTASLENWRAGFNQTLRSLSWDHYKELTSLLPMAEIFTQIRKLLEEVTRPRPAGMISALADTLNPEQRSFFRDKLRVARSPGAPFSIDEQVELLTHHLPPIVQSDVLLRFYDVPLGSSKPFALEKLSSLIHSTPVSQTSEARLRSLGALAALLLADLATPSPMTFPEAYVRIQHLTENDLGFFLDRRDGLAPLVQKLRNKILNAPNAASDLPDAAWTFLEQDLARGNALIAADAVIRTESISKPRRLVEQPPRLAFPRGCVAGNCINKYSFAYSNDPLQRTYYLEDEDGNLLGLAEGTIGTFEDSSAEPERVLYLHTIHGSKINGSDATAVLYGLYASRAELGFKTVVLPTFANIPKLNDSLSVQTVLQGHVANRKEGKFSFLNPDVRTILESHPKFNSGVYDHMSFNKAAVEFVPNKDVIKRITARLTERPLNVDSFEPPEMSRERGLTFALSLLRQHKLPESRQTLDVLGLNVTATEILIDYIEGARTESSPDPIDVYDQKIISGLAEILSSRQRAEELLKELYDDPLSGRPQLFAGRLLAPDAMSSSNRARTLAVAYALWSRCILNEQPNKYPKPLQAFLRTSGAEDFANHRPVADRLQRMVREALAKPEGLPKDITKYMPLIERSKEATALLLQAMATISVKNQDNLILIGYLSNLFYERNLTAILEVEPQLPLTLKFKPKDPIQWRKLLYLAKLEKISPAAVYYAAFAMKFRSDAVRVLLEIDMSSVLLGYSQNTIVEYEQLKLAALTTLLGSESEARAFYKFVSSDDAGKGFLFEYRLMMRAAMEPPFDQRTLYLAQRQLKHRLQEELPGAFTGIWGLFLKNYISSFVRYDSVEETLRAAIESKGTSPEGLSSLKVLSVFIRQSPLLQMALRKAFRALPNPSSPVALETARILSESTGIDNLHDDEDHQLVDGPSCYGYTSGATTRQ